jgi:hypothetical protein
MNICIPGSSAPIFYLLKSKKKIIGIVVIFV